MANSYSGQKIMIGWILKFCLVVVLTNPTGVVGINFPGLTSFGGLRGAQKEAQNTDEEIVPESIPELNSLDEEEDLEWEEFLENEMEEPSYEDYDETEMDSMESLGDEFEDDMETQEERELHPGNYYYNNGYNYNRRRYNNYYSGPAYYSNNNYGPYHNGYYSYYNNNYNNNYNFNHNHNNGYYNGYRVNGRRRPGYYAYNDDYLGFNNFLV
uniref:Uncharacterized protein n=2 Tax=Pseudo-nitzschia delicatissima TaxID=44447 RepID=A0A7S0Y533_9STRA|mmetsp:Transcript_1331/g.2746  ORF Transcript_1331/g.2746 Transcript_1331/m.2746 type:complete len:212 (+) Transcript_1331:120-755(+)